MSCGCETYECIELHIDPCAEYVELPLTATSSGIWHIDYGFNGVTVRTYFTATNAQRLTVANRFNEMYVHEAKIYTEEGGLFNRKCYRITTSPLVGVSASVPVPPPISSDSWVMQDFVVVDTLAEAITIPAGSTLQSSLLIGAALSTLITVDNQILQRLSPLQPIPFNAITGTIDFAALGLLVAGTLITISYIPSS